MLRPLHGTLECTLASCLPALVLREWPLVLVSWMAMSMAHNMRPLAQWKGVQLLGLLLPVFPCSRFGNLLAMLCHIMFAIFRLQVRRAGLTTLELKECLPWLTAGLVHLRSVCPRGRPSLQLSALAALAVHAAGRCEADRALRRWFERNRAAPGREDYAEYTTENFISWYVRGHQDRAYSPQVAADREELYQHILDMYHRGTPIVLLARQAPLYPFFLDLDFWGSTRPDDPLHSIVAEGDHLVLLRCIASALLDIFPQQATLEVAVFCSSGVDRETGRYKASFHVLFPEIIVRRPILCLDATQSFCLDGQAASHILVRDHVVASLAAAEKEVQRLNSLRMKASNEIIEANPEETPEEALRYPAHWGLAYNMEALEKSLWLGKNDWCEILDENPFWHDPRPGRRTGFRLPFTDKRWGDKAMEGRVKLPLGRWKFQAPDILEELPNLTDLEWVRLGDVSRPAASETPMNQQKLQADQADLCCKCLVCLDRR
ncbi:unnamed protein product [Durusdinium trenchii]|uniref:C962R-like N-terminal AEP domain-containing protein n=1 Tax=Durusdinium trenchii TaxID=1381693 RepID=A0ABP0KU10_9DINO